MDIFDQIKAAALVQDHARMPMPCCVDVRHPDDPNLTPAALLAQEGVWGGVEFLRLYDASLSCICYGAALGGHDDQVDRYMLQDDECGAWGVMGAMMRGSLADQDKIGSWAAVSSDAGQCAYASSYVFALETDDFSKIDKDCQKRGNVVYLDGLRGILHANKPEMAARFYAGCSEHIDFSEYIYHLAFAGYHEQALLLSGKLSGKPLQDCYQDICEGLAERGDMHVAICYLWNLQLKQQCWQAVICAAIRGGHWSGALEVEKNILRRYPGLGSDCIYSMVNASADADYLQTPMQQMTFLLACMKSSARIEQAVAHMVDLEVDVGKRIVVRSLSVSLAIASQEKSYWEACKQADGSCGVTTGLGASGCEGVGLSGQGRAYGHHAIPQTVACTGHGTMFNRQESGSLPAISEELDGCTLKP